VYFSSPKKKLLEDPFFYFKFSENNIISVETAKVVENSKSIQNQSIQKNSVLWVMAIGKKKKKKLS